MRGQSQNLLRKRGTKYAWKELLRFWQLFHLPLIKLCYNDFNMTEHTQAVVTPEEEATERAALRRQRWMLAGIIFFGLLLIAGIVIAIIALTSHPDAASNWRDIFIIFMAVESLIVGVAVIVLLLQVASLINLLQNEIKPILYSTSETVNTLRGTTEFLSENMVEPVIKLNSSIAGLRRFFELFGLKQK
jgi:MFS family permease